MRALLSKWWAWPAVFIIACALALTNGPALFGVKAAYFWTDRLVFVLIAMAALLVGYILHTEHLRIPWRRVFKGRVALAAAVIVSVYVVIGLLDSIHFRQRLPAQPGSTQVHYAVEVVSLFDIVAGPLRTQEEKTFSAPFATHLFVKEAVDRPDGTTERVYPRLRYGGAHLGDDVAGRGRDIALTVVAALAEGAALWVALCGAVAWLYARHRPGGWAAGLGALLRGRSELPWHVALYTLLIMMVLAALAVELGPKYHILGTDKVGQDVFYQAVKSIRTGLVIGTLTTLVMLPFAVLLGISAGYFKGWIDDAIQYIYTTLNSIPGVLLIAAAILATDIYVANHPALIETGADRADLRLLSLCIILGITSWTGLCRLLRGESLKLSEVDYIQAATAFGVRHLTIIGRHILPNVLHIVLIIVVLDFSGLVLAEAVLSYVGVGVDPSMISWGNMINNARLEMAREPMVWWSLSAAFLFMFTLVLSANLFSDAVRDAFDPRLRAMT